MAAKKLPKDDPRAAHRSSNVTVDLDGLAAHLDGKHRWVLSTTRADGRPQMSLVTGGMTAGRTLAISTYPERVKARNARRNPLVSVAVMGDEFNDSWVQIDGNATVVDMPEAADAFVEYFRCISGEHPDWDDYRSSMTREQRVLIRVTIEHAGPDRSG